MRCKILKISGHSMEPALKHGQRVLLYKFPFQKYEIGDIVAFKHDGKIYIKRIAKASLGKYFMRGDNAKSSFDSENFGMIEGILGKIKIFNI